MGPRGWSATCTGARMRRLGFFLSSAALLLACASNTSEAPAEAPADSPSIPANPNESPASKEKEKDPSTQIIVGLDSEDFRLQGFSLGGYAVKATVDGVVAAEQTFDVASGGALPKEVKLVAPKDKPTAVVHIEVAAYDRAVPKPGETNGSPPIVVRTATTAFVKGAIKLAYVYLEVRCNTFPLLGGTGVSGPTCKAPGETCVSGVCQSDALGDLPDYRSDWAKQPPSRCGDGVASSVELGAGEKAFAPIATEETLQIEMGGQCGHHLWLGVRMKDIAQRGTTTILSATQPGTSLTVPPTAFPFSYGARSDGTCELPGIRFQVDLGGAKVTDFLGKPLDITLEVKDKTGRKATTTKRVQIAPTKKGGNFPQCGPQ